MEEAKPTIGIVAGNLREAMEFIRGKIQDHLFCVRNHGDLWFIDGRRYFIVTKVVDLMGVRNFALAYYGTYIARKDLADIEMMEQLEQRRSAAEGENMENCTPQKRTARHKQGGIEVCPVCTPKPENTRPAGK